MFRAGLLIGLSCGIACALTLSARAQTPAPEDPRLAGYRQLLSEANERIALYAGQANQLAAENAQLKAQIAKRKQEDEECAKDSSKCQFGRPVDNKGAVPK